MSTERPIGNSDSESFITGQSSNPVERKGKEDIGINDEGARRDSER